MLLRTLPTFVFWGIATAVVTAPAGDADISAGAPATESQLFPRAAYHLMGLIRRPAVQEELRIDADRKAALDELNVRMQADREAAARHHREARAAEAGKERRKEGLEAMNTERGARLRDYHDTLTRILTREQLARLKQLYWRDIGPLAFGDDEVCAALSLTPEQRTDIARLAKVLRKAEARRAEERYLADHPRPSGFVLYRATPEYKQRSLERLCELLDQKQLAAWHGLLGAPCTGMAIPVPPFEVIPVASRCEANPRD